jgi:hypothetical protein
MLNYGVAEGRDGSGARGVKEGRRGAPFIGEGATTKGGHWPCPYPSLIHVGGHSTHLRKVYSIKQFLFTLIFFNS